MSDDQARLVETYAPVDWDTPICPYCDGDLIRHVFQFEDGSTAIAWLCDCEPDAADRRCLATVREEE